MADIKKIDHIVTEIYNEENIKSEHTVSELTELIKESLKKTIGKNLCVIGEISNYKPSKNNLFFTLKDEESTINVVVWNYANRQNKNNLENGKKIKVYGNLVVFAKSGSYNINAYKLELIGEGDLHKEYLKLKEFYTKMGYFNDDVKKKLPINIKKIGILTAMDGAALQDFLYVLKKNKYNGQIFIKNCLVQGKDCPKSVVDGLKILDEMNLDVIVLARGGGSFEDLFGFSDNQIIETIHNCKTCTISAIGHEIDFMLSDFVADIRAPTPSIAGEIISGRESVWSINDIKKITNEIKNIIDNRINILDYNLIYIQSRLKSPREIINKIIIDNDLLKKKIYNIIGTKINLYESELNNIVGKLNKDENPQILLSKGYCIVSSLIDKKISNIQEFNEYIKKNKKLKLKFIDGEAIFNMRTINIIDV